MTEKQKQEQCDKLMDEAFELIECCESKKALKIADKLEKLRYTGAFEVRALAYAEMERLDKAIKVLEEGVKKAPNVWRLWNLLGNYNSDKGKYKQAIDAFKNGLKCEYNDEVTILYNYALVLRRNKQSKEAFSKIKEGLQHSEFKEASNSIKLLSYSLYLGLLNEFKKYNEVVKYSKELNFSSSVKNECNTQWSSILYELAFAYWKLGQNKELNQNLNQSIEFHKHNKDSQWLLRELGKNEDYSNSKYYRILLEGVWYQPFEGEKKKPGFYTSYDVVSDDLDEAMEFIKKFESKEVHASLKIEKIQTKRVKKQPKGVYSTSGYSFYFDK